MSIPGSGGGPSQNLVDDRKNALQCYLQDLVMIPAIKESNQLKAFLGIKEFLPEFYNNAMDTQAKQIKSCGVPSNGFAAFDKPQFNALKEFIVGSVSA